MMKKIVFIYALFFACITFSQSKITKNLGDFSVVKVYNGIELELIKSDEQKLEIFGTKASLTKIKNINGVLKISLPFSFKPADNAADGDILVKLYYKNNLDLIDANEGATITGKEIVQNKIEIKSQEKAFINIVVDVKYLIIRASSGGIIKVSGKALNQEVDLDLYGIYHGYNLKALHNSNVNSGTGAKAEIYAEESLKAKVGFGGSIFYKGPAEVKKDKKVIGGIIKDRN